MQTRTKVIIAVAIVALLSVAAVLGSTNGRARGVSVRTEAVDTRDLVATVTASGNVRARRKVDISSDISARVAQLLVDEGQDVEQGQILLRREPSRYQAALARNPANLSASQ
ncbi:MAG: biotin/lipoyl-binding protein, partial [Gemmatimonadota bacterium]|nr:biotin/lipoyl-binding protein [Gemmatimonadota bacterium]